MYLGIDIGGTTARISSFRDRNLTEAGRIEFAVTQGESGDFNQDFANLVKACSEFNTAAERITGIGLAVAGKVNSERTTLSAAGNLNHWVGQPVVDRLMRAFDCPVVLGNDAEAAALAEALFGHGRTGTDFWFVIWGTGVGGCLVRRTQGTTVVMPGELGHQYVGLTNRLCGCRQYGCLEAYCGGAAIQRHFGVPAAQLEPGDWENVLYWMRVGLHNVVTSQPVPLIVFGGGIANKKQYLLPRLEESLGSELHIVEAPTIKLSAFGESAGTFGARSLLHLK